MHEKHNDSSDSPTFATLNPQLRLVEQVFGLWCTEEGSERGSRMRRHTYLKVPTLP